MYPSGKGPDEELIRTLEKDVIDRKPNVSFDDIAELEDQPWVELDVSNYSIIEYNDRRNRDAED